ncbi:hypothetical protein HZS_4128 [Henneguya salminicola]|nr:hypothetical protein HZS_4128 [Henneguya salminicola]
MKTNNIFDEVISATQYYTHAPKPEKTAYQKMIGELRSTALLSTLATRHIISEATRILSQNIFGYTSGI